MENLSQKTNNLIEVLKKSKNKKLNMLIGVDGFVDEVINVVKTRTDFQNYERITSIEEFAGRISKASGFSTNIEFVPVNAKIGGNGPNITAALLEYGVNIIYAGSIGLGKPHPIFEPMANNCKKVYPLCEPGHTDALEFYDGKLMLGKLVSLNDVTWENFKSSVGGVEEIAEIIEDSELFGMENWTMIPHMNEIWEGLIKEVFPLLKDKEKKPLVFFDLCDPEKKTKEDIIYAMELISKFESKFRAVLGLNEKELYEISLAFGFKADDSLNTQEKQKFLSEKLYKKMNIHCLVIHPTKEALAWIDNNFYRVSGAYCKKPVLTTGAGDNFNAGFCYALAQDMTPEYALLLGVATSGFYVRNGKSPNIEETIGFFESWERGRLL